MEKEVFKSWEVKELIGKGNFGAVYKIEKDGEKEAMKVVNIYPHNSDFNEILGNDNHNELEDKTGQVMKEIDMLYKLKGNTHIVNYIDHYIEKNKDLYCLYLKMEYLQRLDSYYGEEIESGKVLSITYDILNALTICENNNIVHGDIKPQNIMVDSHGNNKLTDFGIAKIMSQEKINNYTPAYAAPEIITDRRYTKQSDLYSLGLVIYQIYNNNLLPFMKKNFEKKDITEIIESRLNKDIPELTNGSKELNEFLIKALNRNPEERFQSAKEMKNELQNLEKNNLLPKVLVALPVMLAVAIKLNTFNVFGAEATKRIINEGGKKSFIQTLTSMTTTAKVITVIVVSLLLGSAYIGISKGGISSTFGQKSEATEIYKDLDAKQTYEKLLKKMNSEVTYFASNIEDVNTIFFHNESYCLDDGITIVQRRKDETPGSEWFEYGISAPNKQYTLGGNDNNLYNYYEYDVDDEPQKEVLNDLYKIETNTVESLTREEKDNKISLIFHIITHYEKTEYIYLELVINDDGYLDKQIRNSMDEEFENIIQKRSVITHSNYNKKGVEDLNEEKEQLKSCDGLTQEEVIKKSGF